MDLVKECLYLPYAMLVTAMKDKIIVIASVSFYSDK